MSDETPSVTYVDVLRAAGALEGVARRTPVLTSREADQQAGAQLFFKCENFQRAGAFKFRGAFNAISSLSEPQKRKGVISFSSGNHAQGVALASQLLGVSAAIVMPSDAPATKLHATRSYGAEIILYDPESDDREAMANALANERGATVIPSSDYPEVIAGQGTAAKELIETVGQLDYLFLPVGGGGLLAGSAIAAAHGSPGCSVIGVEPEAGNDAQQSLRAGSTVRIRTPATIADGARNRYIGKLVMPILKRHVHDIVTVTDEQLITQMSFFAENMKMVVEPTGCLAAAAVLNRIVDVSGARVGVVVSGGNVGANVLASYLMKQAA
jgi:threo-3-hydroxy-L-aspartate ammonia-lyase